MSYRMRGRSGFTLMEILVSIIIIGILMALMLPALGRALGAARDLISPAGSPIGIELKGYTTAHSPGGGDAETLTLSLPNWVVEGDFLMAQVFFEKGYDVSLSTPSGWTRIDRRDESSDAGQAIYYKVAENSEPSSYTWNFSEEVKAVGGILHYIGVHQSDPIVGYSASSDDSQTLSAPSVEVKTDSMLVAFFGIFEKEISIPTPTDMTLIYNVENPQDGAILVAEQPWLDSDGQSGSRSTTPDDDGEWVAHMVTLRPRVPTTTGPVPPGGEW